MNESDSITLSMPPLPYYLGSGCSRFKVGDQHPNRRNLGIYDLLIVVEGVLHIGENGREWSLSRGDTLLLHPDGEHYSVAPCMEATTFYWVHFEHAGRNSVTDKTGKGALYTSRPFGNPHTLSLEKKMHLQNLQPFVELLDEMLAMPFDGRFWDEQAMLIKLLRMLQDIRTGEAASMTNKLAERAARYIRTHYQEKVTNETLSEELHFHPNYIIRCMKEKVGQTPMEYLHEVRLEQAKRLLITTDWTIERIADEIGYRYAPYFSSCFKRGIGMSPRQFRKQYFH
ncbi:AraC family transcriptional regulator [Paenibacillus sp. LHD-117]|uniref:AraC family transcriptional regulator n=1 Tax=Paenibacillus sp. LHD-117 TaxID=3071412 RepID=UPI0027E069AC|nr:AraC family transcriptional regulator [Paenibacillus sp. LHD-117]MDQ6418396.1 AraC family transcriptional regulator [Paenibacillus sp. LHD-117]